MSREPSREERVHHLLAYAREDCPVGRALAILGERWTMVVLREAFFGVRRFEDFLTGVGCARNVLTARLGTLVDEGVLARVPYRDEGRRERFEYRLTDKGREIFPILVALFDWGTKHLSDPGRAPLAVRHRGRGAQPCDAPVHVEIRCADGHGPLGPRDTTPTLTRFAKRKQQSLERRRASA